MNHVPVAVVKSLNSAAVTEPARWVDRWWLIAVVVTSSLLLGWWSLPPLDFAEAAYAALLPLLLWICCRPSSKSFWWGAGVYSWVYWLGVLLWLRHIHWVAPLLLAAVLACFTLGWLRVVRAWLPPLVATGRLGARISVWLGLSALWVVLEWVRSWLFSGFPWAPLALTQWQRPAVLQIAEWTGSYGVSFILIGFNLGLCVYFFRLFRRQTKKYVMYALPVAWWRRLPVEFYLALSLLLGSVVVFIRIVLHPSEPQPLFRAGIVQPYIPAELKWDEEQFWENLRVLEQLSELLPITGAEVMIWPEAATPLPILDRGNGQMRAWVEQLVDSNELPLLTGNLAEEERGFVNGVFQVQPQSGLQPAYYAKQKLVPFGEYIPLRFLPFVDKVVPFAEDFVPGLTGEIIPLQVSGEVWKVGSLLCYEDIFPHLGRSITQAGAEVLLVLTNDAWYGEEAGAWQHAAHSVLRAVETRRPVIRCGNNGWSGWIDEVGRVRDVLLDDRSNIYFRGMGALDVVRDLRWSDDLSFYVRYGDWFVYLCIVCVSVVALSQWNERRHGQTKQEERRE